MLEKSISSDKIAAKFHYMRHIAFTLKSASHAPANITCTIARVGLRSSSSQKNMKICEGYTHIT